MGSSEDLIQQKTPHDKVAPQDSSVDNLKLLTLLTHGWIWLNCNLAFVKLPKFIIGITELNLPTALTRDYVNHINLILDVKTIIDSYYIPRNLQQDYNFQSSRP